MNKDKVLDTTSPKVPSVYKLHNEITAALDRENLTNCEKVALLETIKIDIMLNAPMLIIDGEYGRVIDRKGDTCGFYGKRNQERKEQ